MQIRDCRHRWRNLSDILSPDNGGGSGTGYWDPHPFSRQTDGGTRSGLSRELLGRGSEGPFALRLPSPFSVCASTGFPPAPGSLHRPRTPTSLVQRLCVGSIAQKGVRVKVTTCTFQDRCRARSATAGERQREQGVHVAAKSSRPGVRQSRLMRHCEAVLSRSNLLPDSVRLLRPD
jgi:hypothetical protein